MSTLMMLFLAALLLSLLLTVLAVRWVTKGWVRLLVIAVWFGFLPVAYAAYAELLGLPKPVALEFFKSGVKKSYLVGSHFDEGKAIYLYVLNDNEKVPMSYKLPWDLKTAEALQKAIREAEENHTGVVIENLLGGLLPFAHSAENRKPPKIYPIPQPKMPDKQIPSPGFQYHRPGTDI